MPFFAAHCASGTACCQSVNETRAMYGERRVITPAPATVISVGIFASVTSGAMANAVGVRLNPVRNCTLSRTISSWVSTFALSGPPASSR